MRRFGVIAALLVGCGGQVRPGPDAPAPRDDGGAGDATVPVDLDAGTDADAPITPCPSSPPVAGASCGNAPPYCEYGDAQSPSCDLLFACRPPDKCLVDPPVWQQVGPTATCPTTDPLCPSTYAGANNDASPDTLGAAWADGGCGATYPSCNYAEGFCACDPAPYGWYCVPAYAGCTAAPRPRLGTPCSPDTDMFEWCPFELDPLLGRCRYGCYAGVVTTACPVVAGPPPVPCTED